MNPCSYYRTYAATKQAQTPATPTNLTSPGQESWIRARFDVCDLEKAQPINSGGVQFDSIVCLFTLQDLSNVRAALANLAGCSAEGTLLAVVVEDIGRAAETTRLKTLRAEQHLDALGHIHENILWEKAPECERRLCTDPWASIWRRLSGRASM